MDIFLLHVRQRHRKQLWQILILRLSLRLHKTGVKTQEGNEKTGFVNKTTIFFFCLSSLFLWLCFADFSAAVSSGFDLHLERGFWGAVNWLWNDKISEHWSEDKSFFWFKTVVVNMNDNSAPLRSAQCEHQWSSERCVPHPSTIRGRRITLIWRVTTVVLRGGVGGISPWTLIHFAHWCQ